MKTSKRIGLLEGVKMHRRAVRVLRSLRPRLFGAIWMHAVFASAVPYATLWLSAQIVGELAGARSVPVLTRLVMMTLCVTAVLSLVSGALDRYKTLQTHPLSACFQKLYADKLLQMDYHLLDDQHTHDLLAQINQNANWSGFGLYYAYSVETSLADAVTGAFGALLLTVSLFTQRVPEGALSWLNHPAAAAAMALALLITVYLSAKCGSKAEGLWARQAASARFGNRFFSFFCFMAFRDHERATDIRIYNQQDICEAYSGKEDTFFQGGPFSRLARGPYGLLYGLSAFLSRLFLGMALLFVCLKAWAGAFHIGSAAQYLGAVPALGTAVAALLEALGTMRNNAPFLKLLYEYLDIPNTMYEGSLTTEKRSDREYEIEFRDVSFRYPNQEAWALRHVNARFKVGKRLAIVGENGSGKTTLIKLLCRLYDPDEGEILLNGIDIKKYDDNEYRDLFSVVFQDFQLLAFPLGENVAASARVDRERAETCLKKAGFGGRLASMTLDTCLYKEFTDEGVEISGGEAQKIAIARALYKDAPFIVLDEPTAALDPIAEAEIYEKLNEIVGDKTAVYISHRLSSCKFCDEILVFDQGRIIQTGSHASLLQDPQGRYYALWNAQAKYYVTKDEA